MHARDDFSNIINISNIDRYFNTVTSTELVVKVAPTRPLLGIRSSLSLMLFRILLATVALVPRVTAEDAMVLYTDVSPANTSDSLQRIRDVPIKIYGVNILLVLLPHVVPRVQVRQRDGAAADRGPRPGRGEALPRGGGGSPAFLPPHEVSPDLRSCPTTPSGTRTSCCTTSP